MNGHSGLHLRSMRLAPTGILRAGPASSELTCRPGPVGLGGALHGSLHWVVSLQPKLPSSVSSLESSSPGPPKSLGGKWRDPREPVQRRHPRHAATTAQLLRSG